MIPNTKMIGGGKFLFLDSPSQIKSELNTLSDILDIVSGIRSMLNKEVKNIILMYSIGSPSFDVMPSYIKELYPGLSDGLCMFMIRIYAASSINRISIWVEPAWNPSEYICKGIYRGTENQLMWYKIPTIKI